MRGYGIRRFAGVALVSAVVVIAPPLAAEVLEEPIAVVGDRVILRSEWETQLALYAMQNKLDADSPAVRDTVGRALLEQMVNDQLILIQAERDTTLRLKDQEIDAALEDRLQELRRRFGSDDEYRAQLVKEGLSERDLRVRYRQDVQNQLLKQELIQRKLAEVAVTNGEVREFYNRYQDSLPVQPEAIKLAHILMPVEVSSSTVDSARTRLTVILQQVREGLDFAEAARRYSTDPSASAGGDIGWFGRGDMVGAFEEAAFALAPGQISGIVRSPMGWHLIQCLDRDGNRVHARHIILSLVPTLADSSAVKDRADSVANAVRGGADFCALAQEYSRDEESRKNCGELGWYPVGEMFPEFRAALRDAKSGDIVGPVSTPYGWHVLRVLDRRAEHRFDMAQDWDAIKQMARQDKTNRVVSDWIAEIRQQTYVDIRPITGTVSMGPETR
ncbi:MAG: peptidylprolyl isomerase [Candidatus Zixiibacteriota bacterium]